MFNGLPNLLDVSDGFLARGSGMGSGSTSAFAEDSVELLTGSPTVMPF